MTFQAAKRYPSSHMTRSRKRQDSCAAALDVTDQAKDPSRQGFFAVEKV